MKLMNMWKILQTTLVAFILLMISGLGTAHAQPFGKGTFGADVPFGSETSLAIATGGSATMQLTPTDSGVLGTASDTVTVTSTDVVGYKLYIRALSSTNLANGSDTLNASSNVIAGALATNTWGYNTDASTNFAGITTSDVLIKTATGPFGSGDATQVTYGAKVDNSKPAGNYTTTVVYTAVPQTD